MNGNNFFNRNWQMFIYILISQPSDHGLISIKHEAKLYVGMSCI